MSLVIAYSFLLVLGILCSQVFNLSGAHHQLETITGICLAYIMIEVGWEFKLDKSRVKSYGLDFIYAFLAAALPWIFCSVYFMNLFSVDWATAFLVGVFAAPTSAGVLFAMLAAAGLGTSWLFKKAQVLAVFDDFVAILLLVPFQIIFTGLRPEIFVVVVLMGLLLTAAYRFLHSLHLPTGKDWFVLYGIGIVVIQQVVQRTTHLNLGVLLPAFTLGAVLYNPHLSPPKKDPSYNEPHQEPTALEFRLVDRLIKGSFMFLVGASLPKINFQEIGVGVLIAHVLALTVLSNLGKCFLFFCYRKEVSWRNRLALSIAMFPRGEVGAGVLLIAIGYHVNDLVVSLSVLSLALNLVLTGVFVILAIRLAQPAATSSGTA